MCFSHLVYKQNIVCVYKPEPTLANISKTMMGCYFNLLLKSVGIVKT